LWSFKTKIKQGPFFFHHHTITPIMSAKAAAGVFIVAAKRTPFGSFGGKLRKLSPTGDIFPFGSKFLSIFNYYF
jgi:hypothetical protein